MTATQTAPSGKTTTWQIDPAHTLVEFVVKHLMIASVRGRFSDVSGTVVVLGDDFSTAQVEATIDVASIDTHEPQRDGHTNCSVISHFTASPGKSSSRSQSRVAPKIRMATTAWGPVRPENQS